MTDEKPALSFGNIKEIRKGVFYDVSGQPLDLSQFSNVRLGGNGQLYITLNTIPRGVRDGLVNTEDEWGSLIEALAIKGIVETDRETLFAKTRDYDLSRETARLIPTKVGDQVVVGLELNVRQLEQTFFDGKQEEYHGGRSYLVHELEKLFDQYILAVTQEQLDKYRRARFREKIAEVTPDVNTERLSTQELGDIVLSWKQKDERPDKNQNQVIDEVAKYLSEEKGFKTEWLKGPVAQYLKFSILEMPADVRNAFIRRLKQSSERHLEFIEGFIDLIYSVVLGDVANNIRQQALEYIDSRIAEAGENQTHYQAERQTIEKGFFARLLRKTRTSQEFEQQTGSSFEKTVEELDRAKTYFQKNVGREVLDQVQDVDSTTQELTDEVIDLGTQQTKTSLRRTFKIGEDERDIGVLRRKLDAKDLVKIAGIFDRAMEYLTPRIESTTSEVIFEDPKLAALKASWLYANVAIKDFYDKMIVQSQALLVKRTTDITTEMAKISSKMAKAKAEDKDFKRFTFLQSQLETVNARMELIKHGFIGRFDKEATRDKKNLGGE